MGDKSIYEIIRKVVLLKSRCIEDGNMFVGWSFFQLPCNAWNNQVGSWQVAKQMIHVFTHPTTDKTIIIVKGFNCLKSLLYKIRDEVADEVFNINNNILASDLEKDKSKKQLLGILENATDLLSLLGRTYITESGNYFTATAYDHHSVQPCDYLVVHNDHLTEKFVGVFKQCCHILTYDEFVDVMATFIK